MVFNSTYSHLNIPDQWNEYFSKYPNGYTILEAVINWAGQVNDMTDTLNSTTDYVNNFMATFDTDLDATVLAQLQAWQADGTLDTIITQALQTDLGDITKLTTKDKTSAVNAINENVTNLSNVMQYGLNVKSPMGTTLTPAKGDGVTDDTPALTSIISYALTNNLPIFVPEGTYMISNLQLKSYLVMYGSGLKTIFKQISNTSLSLITLASNTEQVITFGNILLDGNKANQTVANRGMEIINTTDSTAMATASKMSEPDARHRFHNIYIKNTKGDGFYISGRGSSVIEDIITYLCDGVGFILDSQDNIYSKLDAGDSGAQGIHVTANATNIRIVSSKGWYSGRLNDSVGHGFHIEATRVLLANCEAQDNSKHGFVFGSDSVTGVGLLADANGWNGTTGAKTQTDTCGFYFYNASNCHITGVVTDRFGALGQTSKTNYCVGFGGTSKGCYFNATCEYLATDIAPAGQVPQTNNRYNIIWNKTDGTISKVSSDLLTTSATLAYPSIPANSTQIMSVALTGVNVGDSVIANPTSSGIEGGLVWSAWVSASNTVTIQLANVTTGAITPASRGWRVSRIN